MKDGVPKGQGNSRYLRSAIASGTTWEQFRDMLAAGTLPVDFNGINRAGWAVIGDALSKANLLPDDVCDALGINRSTSTPGDALRKCNDFWNETKVWGSIAPVRGATYDWQYAGDRLTLIGNILCATNNSTNTTLKCLNIDTLERYEAGNASYDNLNGAFAYDGTYLYVFGYGSSSTKWLYRVQLYAGSGNAAAIWSAEYGYNTILLFANDTHLIGFDAEGVNRTAWIWNKSGSLLRQAMCKYCYDGFMVGNYLYTCDGGTVYRMTFDGFSFFGETSVAFPVGSRLVQGVNHYAQDKAFYAVNDVSFILYKITAAGMAVEVAFDFSKYIEVNTAVDKAPGFSMSQKRYYYEAYGLLYIFDRGTGTLLGKSKPRLDLLSWMLSNIKNEEILVVPGGYNTTVVKLAEEIDPLIVKR